MYTVRHIKYPLLMSGGNEDWIYYTDFRKKKKILKYQTSWKSVQWEQSCFMRTDWHDKANNDFSQFCERARLKILVSSTPSARTSGAGTIIVCDIYFYKDSSRWVLHPRQEESHPILPTFLKYLPTHYTSLWGHYSVSAQEKGDMAGITSRDIEDY